MAGEKVKYAPVQSVQIEVTRNGYRLKVGGSPPAHPGDILVSNGSEIYWSTNGCTWDKVESSKLKRTKAASPRTIRSSGEYVFPDFASLSAWLKARVVVTPE